MARLYTKKVWFNDQTKLNAKNLNHIEKGIEAVAEAVEEFEAQINNISADQIPSLDASKITSGTLPDERIASAESWNTQINTLTENVTANASQLTGLETSVASINTEIDTLKTTIGDISSILDEINGEVI